MTICYTLSQEKVLKGGFLVVAAVDGPWAMSGGCVLISRIRIWSDVAWGET